MSQIKGSMIKESYAWIEIRSPSIEICTVKNVTYGFVNAWYNITVLALRYGKILSSFIPLY